MKEMGWVEMVNLFGTPGKRIIQENSVELEHIKKLVVESNIASIKVSTHEEKYVQLVLETYENGPDLGVALNNEVLQVDVKLPGRMKLLAIGKPEVSMLYIYLPENFAEYYQIQTTVGNVTVNDLYGRELEIETSAGNITINYVEMEKLTVESGAGNIKLEQIQSNQLVADSGAGNINGMYCKGKIIAESGAGNILFHVDGEEDVTVKTGVGNIQAYFNDIESLNATLTASASVGKVHSDFLMDGNKFSHVFKDGEKTITFKAGAGNINLYRDVK